MFYYMYTKSLNIIRKKTGVYGLLCLSVSKLIATGLKANR